ncbi:Aste57867_11607 [Aphanomyces stellatus]|uniref:Aste57867_11607 protein n=1 Tax=Aphanomyces stellatus TaxID=120398 RepID=A0A485KTY1_9STRA|nr:hypothetical protein As57867_011564 [Aphanomyces stellatus]VFT88465.1 Aste57867_11607 [Aphanomyces stellatus]
MGFTRATGICLALTGAIESFPTRGRDEKETQSHATNGVQSGSSVLGSEALHVWTHGLLPRHESPRVSDRHICNKVDLSFDWMQSDRGHTAFFHRITHYARFLGRGSNRMSTCPRLGILVRSTRWTATAGEMPLQKRITSGDWCNALPLPIMEERHGSAHIPAFMENQLFHTTTSTSHLHHPSAHQQQSSHHHQPILLPKLHDSSAHGSDAHHHHHPTDFYCLYKTNKCRNLRGVKRDGTLHRLCNDHREKANESQRKSETKKRIFKRTMLDRHHPHTHGSSSNQRRHGGDAAASSYEWERRQSWHAEPPSFYRPVHYDASDPLYRSHTETQWTSSEPEAEDEQTKDDDVSPTSSSSASSQHHRRMSQPPRRMTLDFILVDTDGEADSDDDDDDGVDESPSDDVDCRM